MNEKCENENPAEKNLNSMKNLLRISSNMKLRDSAERDNLPLKPRSNNKLSSVDIGHSTAYNQCFSRNNFPPQYEEECPVNYSLKYSETELPKAINKTENQKENFKNFVDYVETDLDQPTNFSLKYAENTCDEEIKDSDFNYFDSNKRKFKRFVEYAETDLDQPTDFTLKYREGVDEDALVKNSGFNYYEGNKPKLPDCFTQPESEDVPSNRVTDNYVCEDETPLMFSRCSSLNSLSSFVHISQSIPDDRSSVVSDFSRMTSGIISPSELPDSPTQTAPSSPRRVKVPNCFSTKTDFLPKKSVFEDDVATYKQEDTPVEFSRATSLSSLNADNSVKSECVLKVHLKPPLVGSKDKIHGPLEQSCSDHLRDQSTSSVRAKHDKEKFDLPLVIKDHESLFSDTVRAGTQANRSLNSQSDCNQILRKNGFVTSESSKSLSSSNEFTLKSSNGNKQFLSETEKTFPAFETAEDVVHTYYTEGTPANISHAASHSNLSTLSMVSGAPSSGIHDNSDDESFHSDHPEGLSLKTQPHKDTVENFDTINKKLSNEPKRINVPSSQNVFLNNQPQFDYLRKDSQLTAKDETATFATENSPCNFSIRSSFSDLTISILDTPLCLNRTEVCEEPPSQMSTPLHNVSPQSPSSINLGDMEDLEKINEDEKILESKEEFWNTENIETVPGEEDKVKEKVKNYSEEKEETAVIHRRSRSPVPKEANFDLYSREPLTPFEEALLEQCIRLGMPQKKNLKENHIRVPCEGKRLDQKEVKIIINKSNPKVLQRAKHFNAGTNKKTSGEVAVNKDNFDFDSSEPLSVFEEALIEQCIRSGMPQKSGFKKSERNNLKLIINGEEEYLNEPSEHITPLEAALLEYCIGLGMPPKRNLKKSGENSMKSAFPDESTKLISSLSSQLNRLKINSDCEKDGFKKGDHFVCNCGKKNSRLKNSCCRRPKTFKEC